MTVRLATPRQILLSIGVVATLSGCATTPLGPTVQAMPGPGKTFDAFQVDNTVCKGFASDQVKGQADAANQRAAGVAVLGTVLGAGLGAAIGGAADAAGGGAGVGAAAGLTTGASIAAANNANDQALIQQQYDNAFAQCMYAKGEQVPGVAPVAMAAPPPEAAMGSAPAAPDPLVRSSQEELIRLGYLRGTADGYMGPRTRAAISAFQQTHGASVTGSPSPSLLAQMQSTPTGAATPAASSTASASAPSNWVAPRGSGASPAAASGSAGSAGWVAPSSGTPAATPAAASGPASSGWVAPTKQ
ncbi:MAG TPA: peptidoglycan-binding domain-containing protein [Acetobacteraceae bacterium]|nr:peptidoglycan-binding domain-containing protein [Acetobacteraceae bacterium]